MDITALTDEQKSVMLARLCGWLTTDNNFHRYYPPDGRGVSVNHTHGYTEKDIFRPPLGCIQLYNPANMALAWRVLNWGARGLHEVDEWASDIVLVTGTGAYNLWDLPPADAQRAWLDKILKLAIEAGMVEE